MYPNTKYGDWSTACPDWEEKIVNGESLMPCKPLNIERGVRALKIFKGLRIGDMIGTPTFGEVTDKWVYDFVISIFASFDDDHYRQLIKEFFLLIAKKNTKSTLAAGIMMTALVMNKRPSADLIIVAPTKEVADNSFHPARDMVFKNPKYEKRFKVSKTSRIITDLSNNTQLKVIAADEKSVVGGKASFILFDEVHAFGKINNAESIFNEATGGLASRQEGFAIYLTTQSSEPPAGIFKKKLDYARDIRDGIKVNNAFLPMLYEFPQKYLDDELYLNPENWHIPNPNYGRSVNEQYLQIKFDQAQDDKESLNDFCAKHLNVQIGIAMRSNRWAAVEYWDSAKTDDFSTLDDLIEASEVIVCGIDGGGLDDLLGFSVIGRLPSPKLKTLIDDTDGNYSIEIKPWWVWSHAWCCQTAVDRRKSLKEIYKNFERLGELTIVDEEYQQTVMLTKTIKKIKDSGKLSGIGLDPYNINSLVNELTNIGLVINQDLIGINQNWTLTEHIKTTEIKIARQDLLHPNQQIMSWCMGNTAVILRDSGVKISKEHSGTGKIDPIISMVNAVALMSRNPEPPTTNEPSVFFV